jgi:hypothetical protein
MITGVHEHEQDLTQKEREEIRTRPSVEEAELDIVMETLAESVLEAPDEEVLEDVRLQGKDPEREAEEVRRVLLKGLSDEPGSRNVVTVTACAPGRQ